MPSEGVEPIGRMLAEVFCIHRDGPLIRAEQPVLLVIKPRAIAALRIPEKSLHLSEALQEIDESLGVVFGDCPNLRCRRSNRPVFVLSKMAAADG